MMSSVNALTRLLNARATTKLTATTMTSPGEPDEPDGERVSHGVMHSTPVRCDRLGGKPFSVRAISSARTRTELARSHSNRLGEANSVERTLITAQLEQVIPLECLTRNALAYLG